MHGKHILLILHIIDIFLPVERKRKYTDKQVFKPLELLQSFNISYRLTMIFLTNHEEYFIKINIKKMPSFQTLSRRAIMFAMYAINSEIDFQYSIEPIAVMDSFMVHTCKCSTAARRMIWG